MGKQIDGEEDDDVVKGTDRISELPQHIFQHILSFLSQQDAVKTCVLSKPCRYLWSTRPNVEFCERDFNKPCRYLWSTTTCPNVEFCGMDYTSKIEKFMDFVDKTLQVYHDQNLSIERFCVDVGGWSYFSLLKKWIPKAVCDLSVKTFELKICMHQSAFFEMPPEFFRAQSLQNLYLQQCRWTIYGSVGDRKPLFKHLRTLHLNFVTFEDGEFEKTMSSCPLIEHVVLDTCHGLRTINFVNNHNFNLKYFKFISYMGQGAKDVNIQIYTPSIKTMIIHWCPNWYYNRFYYSNLKSLHLYRVEIPKESLDSLSSNFPCLEELELNCFGFEEFKLSSPSIKHLRIYNMEKLTKAAIDAPKLVLFEYTSDVGVASFSFATTFIEWKSEVRMYSTVYLDFDASSWLLKISELLTGLSHSEITLDLSPCNGSGYMSNEDADIRARLVPDINYSGFYNKPVVVEHLWLHLVGLYSASSFPHFINALFRVCRPRKMGSHYWYAEEKRETPREHNQIIKSLCKILRMGKDECRDDREMSCWQQDLEEVILEVLAENEEGEEDGVWHPVLATNWLEYCDALTPKNLENDPHELRFILKWC